MLLLCVYFLILKSFKCKLGSDYADLEIILDNLVNFIVVACTTTINGWLLNSVVRMSPLTFISLLVTI